LRRRRNDLRLLFPRRLTLLASTASLVKSLALPEVAAVAEAAEVAREDLAVATEVVVEATEVVAEARDVDPDLKARSTRNVDPDLKARSTRNVDPDLKARSTRDVDPDPKVSRVRDVDPDLKARSTREDQDLKVVSAEAEVREPRVSRVNIAQEPRVAEAEDPELKEKKVQLKVRPPHSNQEERELSATASTALKARRENNTIPSIERTVLAEAEVPLRAVLARATGALLMTKLSKLPLKAPTPRLPLRRGRRTLLSKRRLRLSSKKLRNQLRKTCMLTSSLLLSTLLRRRRQLSRRKLELTTT
jgi:hypothetical protein